MTAFDRLEAMDSRIVGALDEIAAPSRPDYLDDIFRVTARTRQRPRWAFLERWLPMDTALTRRAGFRRVSLRPIVVVAILALLAIAAVAALTVGSRNRAAPPFGPAANGSLIYGYGGDLYVRDSLTGEPRLLIGGPGRQFGVIYSLDGQLIAYENVIDDVDKVSVAGADGSNPRIILDEPFTGGAASWSPDGRAMAVTTTKSNGRSALWIAATDGSGAREVTVDGVEVIDALYNPANDGTLLVRGSDGSKVDLYLIDLAGHVVRNYNLPGEMAYGAYWELSGLAFSVDGRTIAHNSVEPVTDGARFRTYLVDVDGSNPRLLPEPAGTGSDYSQAWPLFSPDGRWVALETWVGTPGGDSINQLGIAPADGSAPPRLVGPTLPRQSVVKSWAPDSTHVLFASRDAHQLFEAEPQTGRYSGLSWTSELPDWQRRAP
jgi:Tol biopolymer transport system component